MSEEIPPGIAAADWAVTPLTVQQRVVSLLETVALLQKRVAELEERVNQTSRNSSKPPSSDPPNAPPRPKPSASRRKAGGQKGHPGHGRSLKPIEQVKRVVLVKPSGCATGGALLLGEDPQPARHQVTELPRIEPEVVEYQRHTLTCLTAGRPACREAGVGRDLPGHRRVGPRVGLQLAGSSPASSVLGASEARLPSLRQARRRALAEGCWSASRRGLGGGIGRETAH